jgi:hypothetical protein
MSEELRGVSSNLAMAGRGHGGKNSSRAYLVRSASISGSPLCFRASLRCATSGSVCEQFSKREASHFLAKREADVAVAHDWIIAFFTRIDPMKGGQWRLTAGAALDYLQARDFQL